MKIVSPYLFIANALIKYDATCITNFGATGATVA